MKLSVKAMSFASGLLWSGGILTCGLINLASPSYGSRFLKMMSSIYPGFRYSRTLSDVLVGAGYGFLDGAMAGALYAALYNQCAARNNESQLTDRDPHLVVSARS